MSQGTPPAAPLAAPQLGSRAAIARNAFYLVIGQVSTTALAIVFSAALGRSLGAGDFALYFLISSFATFAYVVVDWGQQFYVIREVARSHRKQSAVSRTSLVSCGRVGIFSFREQTSTSGRRSRTSWGGVRSRTCSKPSTMAIRRCDSAGPRNTGDSNLSTGRGETGASGMPRSSR